MLAKIVEFAQQQNSIRAALLNGSRVNPNLKPDNFQDYDVVYLVDDVAPFFEKQQWIEFFGKLIIMQKPDEMSGTWQTQPNKFTFLMLFEDGQRIDLTFMQKDHYLNLPIDSLTKVLLDKDKLLCNLAEPSDKDYLPKPATAKEFFDCCNEFLWCSQNVVKGLVRKELTYAKFMSETILRTQLIQLLTWYAGMKTQYTKNLGAFGKYLGHYIEPQLWAKFKQTYVGADYEEQWEALKSMFELFELLAIELSKNSDLKYDKIQFTKVLKYIKSLSRYNKS